MRRCGVFLRSAATSSYPPSMSLRYVLTVLIRADDRRSSLSGFAGSNPSLSSPLVATVVRGMSASGACRWTSSQNFVHLLPSRDLVRLAAEFVREFTLAFLGVFRGPRLQHLDLLDLVVHVASLARRHGVEIDTTMTTDDGRSVFEGDMKFLFKRRDAE